jgi:hypothetical protein
MSRFSEFTIRHRRIRKRLWLIVHTKNMCPLCVYVLGKTEQSLANIVRLLSVISEQRGHLSFDAGPKTIKDLLKVSVHIILKT